MLWWSDDVTDASFQPLFGRLRAIGFDFVATAGQNGAKRRALRTAALFPAVTFAACAALILGLRTRGGYRPVDIAGGLEHS